jgi:mono/diheme cytochrome c family protein
VRLAAPALALIAAALAGCGESVAHHERYLFAQKCAACHALRAGAPSPVAAAPNLVDLRPTVEQVRRAVIDGRRGMRAGLLGGSDVDQVARYVAEAARR